MNISYKRRNSTEAEEQKTVKKLYAVANNQIDSTVITIKNLKFGWGILISVLWVKFKIYVALNAKQKSSSFWTASWILSAAIFLLYNTGDK